MDAAILAALGALIATFGSIMIALLLYVLKTFDSRFNNMDKHIDNHTKKIDCIDRKVVKLATIVGYAHPEIVMRKSPLQIRGDESIDRVVERYMNGEEGEQDGSQEL